MNAVKMDGAVIGYNYIVGDRTVKAVLQNASQLPDCRHS